MKSIRRAIVTSMLGLAFAAPVTALAQQDPQVRPQDSQLATMRADDLKGKKVVNDTGNEVATVDSIVRDKKTNEVEAVVSVDGFIGIGERKVTIALADLGMRGDRVLAPAGTTKEKIENMPQYKEADYEKVDGHERVTLGAVHGGSK